jgi:hypothetical protein
MPLPGIESPLSSLCLLLLPFLPFYVFLLSSLLPFLLSTFIHPYFFSFASPSFYPTNIYISCCLITGHSRSVYLLNDKILSLHKNTFFPHPVHTVPSPDCDVSLLSVICSHREHDAFPVLLQDRHLSSLCRL